MRVSKQCREFRTIGTFSGIIHASRWMISLIFQRLVSLIIDNIREATWDELRIGYMTQNSLTPQFLHRLDLVYNVITWNGSVCVRWRVRYGCVTSFQGNTKLSVVPQLHQEFFVLQEEGDALVLLVLPQLPVLLRCQVVCQRWQWRWGGWGRLGQVTLGTLGKIHFDCNCNFGMFHDTISFIMFFTFCSRFGVLNHKNKKYFYQT